MVNNERSWGKVSYPRNTEAPDALRISSLLGYNPRMRAVASLRRMSTVAPVLRLLLGAYINILNQLLTAVVL